MNIASHHTGVRLRSLSVQDWQVFGLHHLAYIKPVVTGGKKVYGVFAADGRLLGTQDREDRAVFSAHQNDLMPVTLQ